MSTGGLVGRGEEGNKSLSADSSLQNSRDLGDIKYNRMREIDHSVWVLSGLSEPGPRGCRVSTGEL